MSATTGGASSSVQLPAYKGFTVRVSILVAGKAVAPTTMMIQSPIAGHDVIDIPACSFLVENETAGKKVLYDLGFMKAWKEKLPPLSEFSTQHVFFVPAVSSLIQKAVE
jgi:hypothetical protein